MSLRGVAMGTALVGGTCWVANLFVDEPALSVTGLVLVLVAVAAVGAGLVRKAWVGVVSASGSAALTWSVIELLRGSADDRTLEAVLGGVATVLVALAVVRRPVRPANPAPHGQHRT